MPAAATAAINASASGVPQVGGHAVLVLEQQLFLRSAVRLCSAIRTREQHPVRVEHLLAERRDHGRGLHGGAQHLHVAQPAVALLDVGLEQERDGTEAAVPLGDLLDHRGQELGRPLAPQFIDSLGQLVRE